MRRMLNVEEIKKMAGGKELVFEKNITDGRVGEVLSEGMYLFTLEETQCTSMLFMYVTNKSYARSGFAYSFSAGQIPVRLNYYNPSNLYFTDFNGNAKNVSGHVACYRI